jgi:hypothetical protein
MQILYYVGMGLGLVLVGFVMAGFWRGLSLKATDPETRAPDRVTWWIRR